LDQHLILDIGPGVSSVLLALIVAIPGILAAWYGRTANVKIDKANSTLAANLARAADVADAHKLIDAQPK
jgi:hypothetical protein